MLRRKFLAWFGFSFLASCPVKSTLSENRSINKLINSRAIGQAELNPVTSKVIEKIKNIFLGSLGNIYHHSNDQDRESIGIFPCQGKYPCREEDFRSEKIYLPFIMAPRRQTDSLVRQGYLLLSEQIRCDTAFVIADRLVQYPEDYISYIQSRKYVVLIGSFQGIDRDLKDDNDYQCNPDIDWLRDLHKLQLLQLKYSIDLVKSLDKEIIDVVYSMGDSPYQYATNARKKIQEQFNSILKEKGLYQFILEASNNQILSWGADDTVLKSFARQLPEIKLKVRIANPEAKQHYEVGEIAKTIINSVVSDLRIKEVTDDDFDIQAFIFTWNSSSGYEFRASYEDDSEQKKLDAEFVNIIRRLSQDDQHKTIIIDGRNPNGAWDTICVPSSDKFLAFGSWGTFANSCVQTMSIAKLLHFYDKPDKEIIRRQLLLESIAHDVFLIGYKEGKNPDGVLRKELKNQGLVYDINYGSYQETQKVFRVVNQVINSRIQSEGRKESFHLDKTQLVFVPQLWRTFESSVYAKDGELSVAGVYRKDLPDETFNPFVAARNVRKFNLLELVNEFSN